MELSLKIDISGEEYLYGETKDKEKKKLWARARCGNMVYGGDKRIEAERCVEGAGKKRKRPACRKLQRVRKTDRDKGEKVVDGTDWTDGRGTTGNNKEDWRRTEE